MRHAPQFARVLISLAALGTGLLTVIPPAPAAEDRLAGEEVVAAAVVEAQVDDDVDAGEIEVLLAQRPEVGIEVGPRRVQLRHAGVDQHARVGVGR